MSNPSKFQEPGDPPENIAVESLSAILLTEYSWTPPPVGEKCILSAIKFDPTILNQLLTVSIYPLYVVLYLSNFQSPELTAPSKLNLIE